MAKIIPANPPPSPSPKTAGPLATQLFAAFGAPAAWSLQLLVNYPIAAEACFPNDAPLAHPDANMTWDRPALIGLNLLALAVAAIATAVAASLLRRTRPTAGASADPREVSRQRSHFMASCGLLAGFGFIAAILFNTVAAVGVPQCSG